MIWLVIAAALVVAVIVKVSLAIVALAALAFGGLFLLLLVFDVIALIWVSLAILALYTVIEQDRTTLVFIGLGLVGSLVILLDRNQSNLEPVQANPQTGAPRPRRRSPQSLPPGFVAVPWAGPGPGGPWPGPWAAPFDAQMGQPAPPSAGATTSDQPETVAEASGPRPRAVQQTEENWPFIEEPSRNGIWALLRAAFAFLRFRPRRVVGRTMLEG